MATRTLISLANNTYPAGTHTSATYTVPADVLQVTVTFAINAADLADATKNFTFECDVLIGGVWQFDHGFTWTGNSVSPKTGLPENPSITVDVGPLAGQQVRASFTNNASLTTAVTVTAQ